MRIEDFSDVQDLMKAREALQSSMADVDDKLRALGVVMPKPVTEFDAAVERLKAHGAVDDGLHADYDAGVPVDLHPLVAVVRLLGADYAFALREGEQEGTAEIVLSGDGVQKGVLTLGPRRVRKWAAKLAEYAARGV